jgi:hypothetical protein
LSRESGASFGPQTQTALSSAVLVKLDVTLFLSPWVRKPREKLREKGKKESHVFYSP